MKKSVITIAATLFAFATNAQINYNNNTLSGTYASAIGENNDVNGNHSFVGGVNSETNGLRTFAFGNTAKALANNAVALGHSITSNGVASFTFGKYLTANGTDSYVIGKGNTSSSRLVNDIPNSLMIGFNSTKPTFFVSESFGLEATGKIGIGNVTNPLAKLHIKADTDEDVDLLLEPGSGDNFAKLYIGSTENSISSKGTDNLEFNTTGTFYFNNNYVGIHNDTALAPLHIGEDWTFNTPYRGGRTIAYNAYYPLVEPYRINDGKSSAINFTDDGDIKIETAGYGLVGTLVTYDNALWIKDGKVGVKKEPSYELDVEGTTRTNYLKADTGTITSFSTEDLSCNSIEASVINTQNFVVDNTLTVPTIYNINNLVYEELYVNTKITCEELEISAKKWYDNVFDKDYELLPINEVEQYVQKNNHLPSIPSEAEVQENGIDVAEMNALLLKKIEEMTLYIIDLKKNADSMQLEIESLKSEREGAK